MIQAKILGATQRRRFNASCWRLARPAPLEPGSSGLRDDLLVRRLL
jgi:hypothetical protein